jgi:hypothetical protein
MLRIFGNKCFVISQLGEEGSRERQFIERVVKTIIEPAFQLLRDRDGIDIKVEVSNEDRSDPEILKKIFHAILTHRVICVVLFGHRPNVYYEFGLVKAACRPYILLRHASENPQFDLLTQDEITFSFGEPELEGSKEPGKPYDRRLPVEEIYSKIKQVLAKGEPLENFLDKYPALGKQSEDFHYFSAFKELKYHDWSKFLHATDGVLTIAGTSLFELASPGRLRFFTRAGLKELEDRTTIDATGKLRFNTTGDISFPQLVMRMAQFEGVHVRLVIMHEDNEALPAMLPHLHNPKADQRNLLGVQDEIRLSELAWRHFMDEVQRPEGFEEPEGQQLVRAGSISLVKIRRGIIYNRVCLTSKGALVTPNFHTIPNNSDCPAYLAGSKSVFYDHIRDDVDELLNRNRDDIYKVEIGKAA